MNNILFFISFIFKNKFYLLLYLLGLIIFAFIELLGLSLIVSYISYFAISNSSNFFVLLIIKSEIFNFFFKDIFFGFSTLIIIFYIVRAIYTYSFLWCQQNLINKSQIRFSKEIFFNFIKGDIKYTQKFNTNEIINNITHLSNDAFNAYFISYFNLLSEAIVIITLFIFLIYVDPLLFFILVIFSILIGYSISQLVQKKLRTLGHQTLKAFNELSKILFFVVGLYKELASLKIIKKLEKEFEDKIIIFLKSRFYSVLNSRITFIVIEMSVVFLSILMVVFLKNKTNITELLAIYGISLIRLAPSMNRLLACLHEVKLRSSQVSQLNFDRHILASSNKNLIRDNYYFNKKITLDNISYFIDDKIILKNIKFIINKGDKILINGKSGSGKTTIFNILLGLYKISSGKILVDRNIVKNFLDLKNKKSIQTQENYLINDQNIYFNVTFKEENDLSVIENDKKYKNLIKLLSLENFVNSRSEKSNWKVNEFSKNLSGGEKQRLSLARALYSDFEILLMDEPFSSIEKRLANKILKYIMKNFSNKTILIITHQHVSKKYFNKFLYV